jgi:hypothetical protein
MLSPTLSSQSSSFAAPACSYGMRGSLRHGARVWMLWTGLGSLSGPSEKWGCHPRMSSRLGV